MKHLSIILIIFSLAFLCHGTEKGRGYRGFAEGELLAGGITSYPPDGSELVKDLNLGLGISTTHGYQVNNRLFFGIGVNLIWLHPSLEFVLPVYADARYEFWKINQKATPFVDFRLGYNLCSEGSIYLSPTVGYRFNKRKFNIGVGVTYRKGDDLSCTCTLATLRLGFDF